jgi:hypothetical protein
MNQRPTGAGRVVVDAAAQRAFAQTTLIANADPQLRIDTASAVSTVVTNRAKAAVNAGSPDRLVVIRHNSHPPVELSLLAAAREEFMRTAQSFNASGDCCVVNVNLRLATESWGGIICGGVCMSDSAAVGSLPGRWLRMSKLQVDKGCEFGGEHGDSPSSGVLFPGQLCPNSVVETLPRHAAELRILLEASKREDRSMGERGRDQNNRPSVVAAASRNQDKSPNQRWDPNSFSSRTQDDDHDQCISSVSPALPSKPITSGSRKNKYPISANSDGTRFFQKHQRVEYRSKGGSWVAAVVVTRSADCEDKEDPYYTLVLDLSGREVQTVGSFLRPVVEGGSGHASSNSGGDNSMSAGDEAPGVIVKRQRNGDEGNGDEGNGDEVVYAAEDCSSARDNGEGAEVTSGGGEYGKENQVQCGFSDEGEEKGFVDPADVAAAPPPPPPLPAATAAAASAPPPPPPPPAVLAAEWKKPPSALPRDLLLGRRGKKDGGRVRKINGSYFVDGTSFTAEELVAVDGRGKLLHIEKLKGGTQEAQVKKDGRVTFKCRLNGIKGSKSSLSAEGAAKKYDEMVVFCGLDLWLNWDTSAA